MKVILSRKGFDSEFGGYPSPILPDGRMISLPIPSQDLITYGNLKLKFERYTTYYDLMRELKPKIRINGEWKELTKDTRCHLDPDIYPDILKRPKEWRPLFGQIGAAQSHLDKQKVKEGDIFLFFGTFRKTKYQNGHLIFDPHDREKHIIFGYFQIEKKIRLNLNTNIPKWMEYHPHTNSIRRSRKNNTIYVAREHLSFNKEYPGAGVFRYSENLVLTKKGYPKSIWRLPDFFREIKISYHSDQCWRGDCFKSVSRGQEFIIQESEKVENWVKKLIRSNLTNHGRAVNT